ncbi:response regulator transcription factor [Paraburkholderia sp. DHOC27]|uniref:response regulator transcription factor n=1 Tax=Paraburkholderia sp. DHOC27 TaxID=2303330 RepID=UPI000E3D635B|nr:response regulator transcription factor [Paraburkholderia sp. DHOC27]RFU49469.1 DNA-binding response regulator [Paraburkholderia sp. DHOC27]
MKLVTLEKDADNPLSLANMLRAAGYHCRGYRNINELVESPWVEACDLVIIDTQEMKLDGRLIGYLAQTFWSDRPMLFVGNETRRPTALGRTEDAYLAKPVTARALIAGVKTTLAANWARYTASDALEFGRYRFEPDGRGVLMDGVHIALTHKEYQLALLLFRNLARPVSRVYLAETVWRHDERINARTMTAHVSTIRSKLELRAFGEYALSPIYNYGYRLDPVRRPRGLNIAAAQTLHG